MMEDDSISRQGAVAKVKELFEMGECYCDKYSIVGALNELPSAEPKKGKWILCSERMPEVRQWVLCQCRAGIMDVLRLTADGSWDKNYPHTEYMSGFVVAWMPLPKPYKGDKE